MSLVETYVFRVAFQAFLAGFGLLTGVIWVTQVLRELDVMIAQGQPLLVFLAITGLTIPQLVVVIAPVALFISVLYSLNKLNGDSELVVMSASGFSPAALLRPFALLTIIVMLLTAAMSLWAVPWAWREIRIVGARVSADFIIHNVTEGQFVTLTNKFVFHYRNRGPYGTLLGIFMQDRRDPDQTNTYLADLGKIEKSGDEIYLMLEEGSLQRQRKDDLDPAIVAFKRYAVDLSQFGGGGVGEHSKARELSTMELLTFDPTDPNAVKNASSYRSELLDRFVSPLYAVMFGMLAFATLCRPRTTRQGRGIAIAVAILIALVLRVAGFAASTLLNEHRWTIGLDYAVPLAGVVAAVLYAFGGAAISRFVRAIANSFATYLNALNSRTRSHHFSDGGATKVRSAKR